MSDSSMPSNAASTPQVQKAVTFFTQKGLTRFLVMLRDKYTEVGHVGGQIVLQDSPSDERREIASFLSKPSYKDTTIRVKLVDVDNALRKSGFACTLPELLASFFPGQPLETRQMQRTARLLQQQDFHEELLSLASEFPEGTQGHVWLIHGIHGIEWLFSRYKNAFREIQQQQLLVVRYVASILSQLPPSNRPEQLAIFAQRTSGDPHMLDSHKTAGRLFLLALNDLALIEAGGGEDTNKLFYSTSPNNREQELRLYKNAGLLVDTISSNVAVFNLAEACYHNASPDPLIPTSGGRVLLLPMRQLLDWQHVRPARTEVYIVENPQVFEEIVSGLDRPRSTLICTSGWPSVAATMLLDLIITQSSENHFYYSGDFDVKGLQIAAYLVARYPERCHLWHFDPDSYMQAMRAGGNVIGITELATLNELPDIFASLIQTIREEKLSAYQEGIAHLLLEDIKRADQ